MLLGILDRVEMRYLSNREAGNLRFYTLTRYTEILIVPLSLLKERNDDARPTNA